MGFRRAEDRIAHLETRLLAHTLDILAMDVPAEMRLAGVLALLARTVRARRAAVLASSQGERRVAVSRAADEPADAAHELAAWLDAWAPRSRAHRAAAGPASVLVVSTGAVRKPPGESNGRGPGGLPADPPRHFGCLPIPAAGDVALGFDFQSESDAASLQDRLPPQLARHAAVALALVTEQLARERELERLRSGEAERNQFVSTVAHELRTPLTALSGYLELILGDRVADPTDQRDFLERSRQIVEAMAELVGDLLDLSRLEVGSLTLEIAPFSPTEVVTRVAERLAPIAIDRQVLVRTQLGPRLHAALGDRRRAEQILTNLVANALKFAPARTTIEVASWLDGPVALIAVRDEGRGITPDDRRRIFDRFYRMPGHERISGTGLGLPIARELARAMGGELDVASVPGSGSSFVVGLAGANGAPADVIARHLAKAVAAEEVRLEEQAVLRAMAGTPRQLVPAVSDATAAGRTERAAVAADGPAARNPAPQARAG